MHSTDWRALPLLDVLWALGWDVSAFTILNKGRQFLGRCPIHGGNDLTFSFNFEGRYRCLSCQTHGKGAIELIVNVRKCSYRDAVAFLERFRANSSLEWGGKHQRRYH